MTAKTVPLGNLPVGQNDFDRYDQELMTAVVDRAEKIGKQVQPLIVPTNNPLFAVISTARNLQAQELILGASNTYTTDEQFEQIAFYWINLHEGQMAPLTVRILSKTRDVYLDLGGGSHIPKFEDRQIRSVAELRSAGQGVRHAMLIHLNNRESSELFEAMLTMLDPQVTLSVACVGHEIQGSPERNWARQDAEQAQQLRRDVTFHDLPEGAPEPAIVQLARETDCDVLIAGLKSSADWDDAPSLNTDFLIRNAPCRVCLVASPPSPSKAEGQVS
jgi:nucleotide-binding universal stress UspA family protein